MPTFWITDCCWHRCVQKGGDIWTIAFPLRDIHNLGVFQFAHYIQYLYIYIYIHTYCVTIKFLGQFVHLASSCAGSKAYQSQNWMNHFTAPIFNPKQSQEKNGLPTYGFVWNWDIHGYPQFSDWSSFSPVKSSSMLGVKPHCEDATQLKRLLSRGILAGMEEASFPTDVYLGDLLILLFFFFLLGGSLKRRQCGPWINLTTDLGWFDQNSNPLITDLKSDRERPMKPNKLSIFWFHWEEYLTKGFKEVLAQAWAGLPDRSTPLAMEQWLCLATKDCLFY